MDEVEVIFGEAIFREVIFEVDIIIEWIEVGKIGEHGDILGHFANECPNLTPEDSDKESNSARSVSLHLADSDTGLDMEQYLNI